MSLPLLVLKKAPNQILCGCLCFSENVPSVKEFVLAAPYDVESVLTEMNNHIVYILGKSRRTILFWKLAFATLDGVNFSPVATQTSDASNIERLLSFNADYTKAAAVSFTYEVIVYGLVSPNLKTEAVIDTAGEGVITAQFHRSIADVLVLLSQDRTFKIWNVSTPELIFQSHVISGSIPCSLAISPFHNQMAIAVMNGTLLGYSVTAIKATNSAEMPHSLYQVDLRKKIFAFVRKQAVSNLVLENVPLNDAVDDSSSRRSVRKVFFSRVYPTEWQDGDDETAIDAQVVNQFYFAKTNRIEGLETLNIHGSKHYSDDIRSVAQYLLILLPRLIVHLNLGNLEIDQVICLPENVLSGKFCVSDDSSEVYCTCTTSNTIVVVALFENAPGEESNLADELGKKLSMVANEGILPKSVLRTAKVTVSKSTKDQKPLLYKPISQIHRQPGTLDKKGKIVDNQPITFHHKVRSSGYASSNTKIASGKKTKPTQQPSSAAAGGFAQKVASSSNSYPMSGPPPSELAALFQLSERPTGVTWLQPNYDGKSVAFSMTDGLVGILSVKTMANPRMFVHHRQCIRRVAWSKCCSWLTASCDDGTASIWAANTGERLYEVNDDGHPFRKSINHVQFYYLDQFLLATVGNDLNLYSCAFTSEKSDVKRYQVNSVVKRVTQLSIENAQYISAANAVNTFHSYLCICAASDHSLNVFDFNVGKCVLAIEEAHSKPAHCIALTGDMAHYAAVPQSIYNLFATIAVGDVVKLWDLRQNSPVRSLQGHVNRSCPFVTVAFSPCARFLVTGSEDRSAYIYDIRADRPLNRLDGGVLDSKSTKAINHSDTVTCVSFNPARPQLLATTLDGNIYKYNSKS